MKVVQFTDALGPGGKERQLIELLKGLNAESGIDCELIVMADDIHYSYLDKLDIPLYILQRQSKKDPIIFLKLFKLLKQIQPDILHSWNSMCSIYALPVVKLLGIKFVNGFLRNAPPPISIKNKDWLRSKLTFPFSDAIVANSIAGLDAYHVPSRKAYYVHNGFDIARIANLPDSEEVRNRLGVETDKIVGMVAAFSDKKDHATLLSAAQIILSERNDVSFLMVGDGYNLETCRDKILPQFKNRIKFLGKKTKVEEIVNIFSVGVLCSTDYGEGISNSIMEYMALGKPVIATDCGGNRELVANGETGFLIGQGNIKELTAKIIQLLDQTDLAAKFGEAGYKRIISEFSLEKMTGNFINLYNQILL